jgi:hypothetical protein
MDWTKRRELLNPFSNEETDPEVKYGRLELELNKRGYIYTFTKQDPDQTGKIWPPILTPNHSCVVMRQPAAIIAKVAPPVTSNEWSSIAEAFRGILPGSFDSLISSIADFLVDVLSAMLQDPCNKLFDSFLSGKEAELLISSCILNGSLHLGSGMEHLASEELLESLTELLSSFSLFSIYMFEDTKDVWREEDQAMTKRYRMSGFGIGLGPHDCVTGDLVLFDVTSKTDEHRVRITRDYEIPGSGERELRELRVGISPVLKTLDPLGLIEQNEVELRIGVQNITMHIPKNNTSSRVVVATKRSEDLNFSQDASNSLRRINQCDRSRFTAERTGIACRFHGKAFFRPVYLLPIDATGHGIQCRNVYHDIELI